MNIIITCSALSECQGIIDILYAEDKLPFWDLFSSQPIHFISHQEETEASHIPAPQRIESRSVVNFCKQVGFEVNMHLSTSSNDGLFIIQGLLTCINKCCGRDTLSHKSLFIRYLNLSETNITDSCLEKCYPLLPLLEIMDCRRCPHLKFPLLQSASSLSVHVERVLLDGCWQIDVDHLFKFEEAYVCLNYHDLDMRVKKSLFIDMIHESLAVANVEVVILSPPHTGEWVRCNVIYVHNSNSTEIVSSAFKEAVGAESSQDNCESRSRNRLKRLNVFSKCDIFVWETLKFDHAAGFSSMPAFNISRKHLRHCKLL